jgi:hypothetical protein
LDFRPARLKIGPLAKRDNFFPPNFWNFSIRGADATALNVSRLGGTVLSPVSFIFLGPMEKWEKIFSFIRVDAGYDVRLSWIIFVSGSK